jgi:hypothetical protein
MSIQAILLYNIFSFLHNVRKLRKNISKRVAYRPQTFLTFLTVQASKYLLYWGSVSKYHPLHSAHTERQPKLCSQSQHVYSIVSSSQGSRPEGSLKRCDQRDGRGTQEAWPGSPWRMVAYKGYIPAAEQPLSEPPVQHARWSFQL